MVPMSFLARSTRSVAAVLLLLFGVLSVAVAVLSRDPATGAGLSLLTVSSGSMVPEFHAGDAIIVRRADETTRRSLRPGVVVTFRAGDRGQLVTHRIVSVIGHADGRVEYVTKGDANRDDDATPVDATDVVGTLGWLVPFGGYAVRAVRDVRVPFLLLLAVLSAAWSLSCTTQGRRKGSPVMPVDTTQPPTTEGTIT